MVIRNYCMTVLQERRREDPPAKAKLAAGPPQRSSADSLSQACSQSTLALVHENDQGGSAELHL
jgi:hypothetical protein